MANFEYTDMDYRLKIDERGNVLITRGTEAIIQSLRMLMAAFIGEYVRSLRGSRLLQLIGRSMSADLAEDIGEEITKMIQIHEPRVSVTRVRVRPNYDQNYYEVSAVLRERSTQQPFEFATRIRSLAAAER